MGVRCCRWALRCGVMILCLSCLGFSWEHPSGQGKPAYKADLMECRQQARRTATKEVVVPDKKACRDYAESIALRDYEVYERNRANGTVQGEHYSQRAFVKKELQACIAGRKYTRTVIQFDSPTFKQTSAACMSSKGWRKKGEAPRQTAAVPPSASVPPAVTAGGSSMFEPLPEPAVIEKGVFARLVTETFNGERSMGDRAEAIYEIGAGRLPHEAEARLIGRKKGDEVTVHLTNEKERSIRYTVRELLKRKTG